MFGFARSGGLVARQEWALFPMRYLSHALVFAWGLAVVAGVASWAQYESEPGAAAKAPGSWPKSLTLVRDEHRPTLLVALHPQCPCSKATVAELSAIMAQSLHRVHAYVVFMHLEDTDPMLAQTPLRDEVSRIPGVEIVDDRDGRILQEFGALTSGQTYLYDELGRLVFQGGITPVRGQTGGNRGSLAIVSYLASRSVNDRQTPTYGCPLSSLFVE